MLPWAKPRSSSVLSSAGIIGSVSAPTKVLMAASAMPVRAERKYGHRRLSR
jgi:hypothetical protein